MSKYFQIKSEKMAALSLELGEDEQQVDKEAEHTHHHLDGRDVLDRLGPGPREHEHGQRGAEANKQKTSIKLIIL